jgi:glycosyltransferase involved in cell wall biosynthesis
VASAHPLVSVVIPAYNAAATIEVTLGSVFMQTLDDFEVIVVDDASTDDTRDVLATVADPRLRVIALGANRGAAHARNVAMDAALGSWIALLDADDTYAPDRLATLMTHARRLGHRVLVFDRLAVMAVDDRGRRRLARTTPRRRGQRIGRQLRELPAARFAAEGFAVHPVFHRSLLDGGVRFPEKLRVAHDYAFILLLLNQPGARLVQVNSALYQWLVRVTSLTSEPDRINRLRFACEYLLDQELTPPLANGVRQRLRSIDVLAEDEQLRHELRQLEARAVAARVVRDPRTLVAIARLSRNSARYRWRLLLHGVRPPSRRNHPAS